MAEYSVEICKGLEQGFAYAQLHRPMRVGRFEAGTKLEYDVRGLRETNAGRVQLIVEQFVGGGFAGQVYKVRLLEIEPGEGAIEGLEVGQVYAMKILIPPSGFSRLFRNLLYRIGFQGRFQPQVNPAAARAGALWQKFIRRAAKVRFGDEDAVVDIYAIFVDEKLGSCGELSEWIEGRTWRMEVDDRLDLLKRWRRGKEVDEGQLGSAEYRAKREFMARFVELLYEMGAYEFARQYEWSTCKSQPNCLKRRESESDPSAGLVAVDFRAGLVLLPFLPMSPGDFKLIVRGIARGSLVQFDRGSLKKLEGFVEKHRDEFADSENMLEELKAAERVYRDSVPDITHNHLKLIFSRRLWSTMVGSAVTGWRTLGLIDEGHEQRLRSSGILRLMFFLIGLIPFLGKFILRIWGRVDWRRHYWGMLTSGGYLCRAVRGKMAEKIILWHRAGRVGPERALKLQKQFLFFLCHLPLSILPAGLHRFLTDFKYAKEQLAYYLVRPVRLYFNAELREQWLREMVTEGRGKHMLSDEDASVIISQVNEPFIQKYLKSLAVHICTLPVTQIVSVTIAAVYYFMHRDQSNAWMVGLGIIGFFQVVPISPGSLVRGLYVVYLVIRERNFRDYNIAVFLGFFKYVGYLAFPIQMTYHYPALARFMAAHWATEAVHVVPVFGERGALLEHWVFCLFYNWPLTIRRRMRRRAELRASMKPRYWHVGLYAIVAAAVFGLADFAYLREVGQLPGLKDIWLLVIVVPLVCGAGVTLGCGGAKLGKRIVAAAICGILTGVIYTVVSAMINQDGGLAAGWAWRMFIFAAASAIGAFVTELKLPGKL